MRTIARRDFLKAAAAVSLVAPRAPVRISAAAYTPRRDYPIRAQRAAAVTVTDAFWQPKLRINADVTIPIEVRKLADTPRGFAGNVLEAAILSLESRPDAALQAQVDAAVARLAQAPDRGNAGFEVAATWFAATGRRESRRPCWITTRFNASTRSGATRCTRSAPFRRSPSPSRLVKRGTGPEARSENPTFDDDGPRAWLCGPATPSGLRRKGVSLPRVRSWR